jgi:hypothetical protein
MENHNVEAFWKGWVFVWMVKTQDMTKAPSLSCEGAFV